MRMIQEKVSMNDREEYDQIFIRIRVYIIAKFTSEKERAKGRTHTVPVLLVCKCRSGDGCKEES